MKKLLIILIGLAPILNNAQKVKEYNSISYDEIQANEIFEKFNKTVELKEYILKNGNTIRVGDTLVIGKPSNQNNLENSKVIAGASTNNHSYIYLGTAGSAMMGVMYMGNETMTGDSVIVTEIKMSRFNKKNYFDVWVSFNKTHGKFLNTKKLARANIEDAISSKELYLTNALLTRDEAILQLKEAKDLLDLGLIDEARYNQIKLKLTPVIMGSK